MGIRRILRAIGNRWWLVVLIAILGGVIGMTVARNYNDGIKPRWRAEAPITFIQLDDTESAPAGGSGRSPQAGDAPTGSASIDVSAEVTRAQLLLEDTLLSNDSLSIAEDRDDDSIMYFVAVGRNGEETIAAAVALRAQYETVGATVLDIDQIEATMATLLVDIDRVEAQVDRLTVKEAAPEDGAVTARRTALQTEIDTINLRQAQIRIWIANPELRPTEEVFTGIVITAPKGSDDTEEEPVIVTVEALRAERDSNAVVLSRLNFDISTIPDPPVTEDLDPQTALEFEALTLDLTDFQAQYVDLLRRSDGRPPGGFAVEPIVINETATEVSVPLAAFLGFLAGGILAAAALVGIDMGRSPVWAASDLERTVSLGVIDRDRSDATRNVVWYPASVSQRRRDIQALRATSDPVFEGASAVLGITGVDVPTDEVKEIAADLATAYTVAGHNVLLIEGSGYYPNVLAEFGAHADDINMILSGHVTPDDTTRAINEILDSTPEVIPGLTAIHVGGERYDPIDAFASPNCRILMEVARTRYDIIVLAGPDLADPLADAVARRVDCVLLVGWIGHSKIDKLETAVDVLADRRTVVAGTVLLTGKRQTLLHKMRAVGTGDHGSETSSLTRKGTGALTGAEGNGNEGDNRRTTTHVSLERLDPASQDDGVQTSVTPAAVTGTVNVGQDSANTQADDSDQ